MAYRILLIEDSADDRERLLTTIAELGCETVGIANGGAEALQVAQQTRPDLALVHMKLRTDLEGFRIVSELRFEHHLPVVVLGPSSSEEMLQQACSSGSVAYLTEPLRPDDFGAAIRIALHQGLVRLKPLAAHSWLVAMIESLSDGVIATSADGIVQFINPAAQVLTGWMPLEAIGRPIEEIYPLLDIETREKIPECQIRKALVSQLPTGKRRFLLTTRTGDRIVIEDSASLILEGTNPVGAVTIFTNIAQRITDEKAASERQDQLQEKIRVSHHALDRSSDELASLMGRWIDFQEQERRRIARELHDDLAQRAAIASQLVYKMTMAKERKAVEAQVDFEVLKSMIDELSDGLRKVSHRLHPAIIADLGLPYALRSLARDYRALGLDLAGIIDDFSAPIPLEIATSLYRIAQEALHNTLRHAPGAPVKLVLKLDDNQIELRIEDAGPGFSLVNTKQRSGLGLLSMRERARIIGGSFQLETSPGEGTVVLVTAPLETHDQPKPDSARRRSHSDE